jgi:hypothetical protein
MSGYSNRIRTLYYDDAGQVVGADKTFTYTGGSETKISETITGGGAPVITFTLDVSALVSTMLLCTRNLTITVNDDGTPDATITLLAGVPKMWSADIGGSNPWGSVDVTSFKATLAAGADADLTVITLVDPTP